MNEQGNAMGYLDNLFGLKEKVALLTGGGGVLAGAIGDGLAKTGVKVVLADLNAERARAAAEKICSTEGEAYGIGLNVLHKESLELARDRILEKFGSIDILLNAAGGNMPGATIPPDKTVFDLDLDDMDKVSELNFKGTVLPSMVFGKTMSEQDSGGNIINISSMAAIQAITRVVGYSASKAAVSNFTMWLAMEMAMKFNAKIRVNAIAPGFFIGNQNRDLLTNPDGSYTERGQKVIANTPMGRFGEAHELIGAILYLAGDASSFVTGVVLPIDGGFSIFSGV
jgi:NAD(P)-dependent dehydrogenase (short-subunit alcohol dehydrogenase family)